VAGLRGGHDEFAAVRDAVLGELDVRALALLVTLERHRVIAACVFEFLGQKVRAAEGQ
jgi:hypothetical protein